MKSELKFLVCMRPMPLMSLPVRSTIVPIQGGSLLISPGSRLTSADFQAAGSVTEIVAPNLYHCGGVQGAMSVFTKAKVWGPPGARQAHPQVDWTHILGEDNWPFEQELAHVLLEGNESVKESVFFHVASKTLIVTDLLFNIQEPRGVGALLLLKMFGTYKRLAMSRLFTRFVSNKSAFEKSLEKLLAFEIENLVVGHGDPTPANSATIKGLFQQRGFLL